jgi:diacylglycerol O-acyltransferase / wax synthase
LPGMVRGSAATLWRGLRKPMTFAVDSANYVASARRVLSPPDTAGLPALAARGPSWRFVGLDVDLASLKSAAKAAKGSVNDAFIAALLAAFRLYHDGLHLPVAADAVMPVSVPVSVRKDDDADGGNHFAPARLAGPVGEADPYVRVQQIGRLMHSARCEPALESAEFITPVLARLPGSLLVRVAGATTAGNDLQASNVPGMRDDLYLAGAKIERIYPFAPLPGCAAMITLHSYRDICCVGANLDAAAITDIGLFGQCLQAGFAEVLDLHPGAVAPVVVA